MILSTSSQTVCYHVHVDTMSCRALLIELLQGCPSKKESSKSSSTSDKACAAGLLK